MPNSAVLYCGVLSALIKGTMAGKWSACSTWDQTQNPSSVNNAYFHVGYNNSHELVVKGNGEVMENVYKPLTVNNQRTL